MSTLRTILAAAVFAASAAPSAFAYSGEIYAVCKLDPNGDNFLALRSCASSNCHMIRKLGPGTFLLTWEPNSQGRWRQVTVMKNTNESSATGPSGWVYDRYICEVRH